MTWFLPGVTWRKQRRGNPEGVTEPVDHFRAVEEMVNLKGNINDRVIHLEYATKRSALTAWQRATAAAATSSVTGSVPSYSVAGLGLKKGSRKLDSMLPTSCGISASPPRFAFCSPSFSYPMTAWIKFGA